MTLPGRTSRSRVSRVLLAAGALVLVGLLVRSGLQRMSRLIESDSKSAPPSLQIHQLPSRMEAIPDPELGFVLPPNLDQLVESADYTARVRTDSRGFPNAGPWPAHADIVFLGDSLIMGDGVGVDKSLVALVGAALPNTPVLNLGNPGAGPERQYRVFKRFGAEMAPRLVVACLFLAADLQGNVLFHAWLEDPKGLDYNRFRNTYQRRQRSPLENFVMIRLENNPTYLWLQNAIEPRLWGDYRIPHRRVLADGAEVFFDRGTVKFAKQTFHGDESTFGLVNASLDRLRALTTAANAELVVVLIPSKEELFAVNPVERPGSAAAIVRRRIVDMGIPVLDLYPILAASAGKQTPYYTRDIHLNAFGNRVAADALLQWPEFQRMRFH